MLRQEPSPLIKGPVAGEPKAATFIGGGDEAEEQLGAGEVERGKAELIDDQQVGAQEVVNEPADGIVSEPAVKGLDQVCGGEADPKPSLDSSVTQADEEISGARRADLARAFAIRHPRMNRERIGVPQNSS